MANLQQRRSRITRLLHLLLAIAIVTQLALSLGMKPPRRGLPGDQFFELHEKAGLASLALLTLFWIWSVVRTGETRLSMLLPWFSTMRRQAFFRDLGAHVRALRNKQVLLTEEKPFASGVHGLGLLIATLMAATGSVGYFVPGMDFLLEVHETAAPLMWAYLVGHAGIAILHQLSGDALLTRMFSLGKR